MRYRVSDDGGATWGSELILRDDGGSWDLGYPRVVEVSPGRLATVYYMNRRDDPIQLNGGVRHIVGRGRQRLLHDRGGRNLRRGRNLSHGRNNTG